MYTYRVLNNLDYDNLEANGKIIAKKSFSSNNTILEALKTVGGHIQNGSRNDYPWISTSTSFTTVVEHYAVPYNGIKQRPLVAIINGLTKNSSDLDVSQTITNNKVIINVSNDEYAKEALENGLLYNKKGEKYTSKNRKGIKSTPGTKYARKSKEIIILNEIDSQNITYILNPLEIDLYYAIAKYLEQNGIEFDDFKIIDKVTNLTDLISSKNADNYIEFNKNELELFEKLYIEDLFLGDIVENCFVRNGSSNSIDILEIYAYFKQKKRNIISSFMKYFGYDLTYIPILEDNIHIVRVGNISIKNSDYINRILDGKYVLKHKIFCKEADYSLVNNHHTFTHLFYYEESGVLYSLASSEGIDVITDDIDKKLEFDTEKIKVAKINVSK